MSKPHRSRIRLLAAARSELERPVSARTASQQDAYPAQIILRVAGGHTDAAIGRDMGLAERTVWLWRTSASVGLSLRCIVAVARSD